MEQPPDWFQYLPEIGKVLGGWFTGALTFLGAMAAYKKRASRNLQDLIGQYKKEYVAQGLELIQALKSDAKKRKVLIRIQSVCPECYEKVVNELGSDYADAK